MQRRTWLTLLALAASGGGLSARAPATVLPASAGVVQARPMQDRQEPRYPSPGPGHFIKETRENGRVLVLEDKSVWEVEPRSVYRTREWQELEGISVRFADGEPPYAYELSNVDRDEGVAARWVRPER